MINNDNNETHYWRDPTECSFGENVLEYWDDNIIPLGIIYLRLPETKYTPGQYLWVTFKYLKEENMYMLNSYDSERENPWKNYDITYNMLNIINESVNNRKYTLYCESTRQLFFNDSFFIQV
jgi:hypothetical protein